METIQLYENFIKIGQKKKIILFQGSPRSEDSCAGQESKSEKLINYVLEYWSEVFDFEVINLAVKDVTISPCKGCVSTSNGMHCHWKCSCYAKGMEVPDLIYEEDVYDKLENCDAFVVVSPINWYSVSTQVKALFDRLVCANLTITKDQADEIFGEKNIKNAELTGRAEVSGKYKNLLKNHLEGKFAAFYVHGDDGASDYGGNQPDIGDRSWDIKNSIMPLVYQCRYSMINCPDDLIECFYINKGVPYYEANLTMEYESKFFSRMDNLLNNLNHHLRFSR